MKKMSLRRISSVMVAGLTILTMGCSSISNGGIYQISDDISAYGSNDSVFEEISVPYQECNADFTVYVSSNGSNENDGTTLETAVSSVKQAQVLVRKYLESGGTGDCQILLGDGEYFLSSPLALTKQDVANGNKLYIRAINANQATLSGAKKVSADSIEEVEDKELGRVWKIPCMEEINQLYIDNSYAVRARFPDAGEELRLLNWDTTMKNIIIDATDIEGFETSDFEGSTLFASIMWSESYLRVSNVEDNGKTAAVNLIPADLSVFSRTTPQIKERQSYHFENAKAFLSTYGEWYYAADEGVVYYIPYENETLENTTVRIPYTEELLTVAGSETTSVEGISVEGINFKWTGNRHVDGKIGNQANKDDGVNKRFAGTHHDGRPIAGVSLQFAKDIVFSGNIFACMGGGAVDFVEGVHNATVEKNMFYGIGGNGVFTGPIAYGVDIVSTEEATFIKNIKVENNYFHDIAWQEYGGCAVIFNYAVDSVISHNTINNAKYSGISVGWGWQNSELPFLQNVEVSFNKVTNVLSHMSDGGAIYLVGCQPNSTVKNNYINHVFNSVYKFPNDLSEGSQIMWATAGIYLDQGVGGMTAEDMVQVTDNVIVEEHVESQVYNTHNAKADCYKIKDPKESDVETIEAEAGVKEEGFTLLPKAAVLYGSHTESKEQISVYGENLGSSSESVVVVKDKDGKFTQVSSKHMISWTDSQITFETENYASGDVFVLHKSGMTSNKIYATCNVDEDYCMYSRFEDEWGGFSGLARLITQRQDLRMDGFACSSTMAGWPANAIDDSYQGTGWSSDSGDPNPWISFELDGISTVEKIVIYARAGINQEECRRNFNVYGIDAQGNEHLVYAADKDTPVFEADGLLVIDVSETEFKDTVFRGFRIGRPEGDDTYFFVAEIAVI